MSKAQKVIQLFLLAFSVAILSVALEYLFAGNFFPRILTVACACVTSFVLFFPVRKNNFGKGKWWLLAFLFLLLFINASIRWTRGTFPLRDVDQVLMTLQMPLDGFVKPFVTDFCKKPLLLSILFSAFLFLPVRRFYACVKFSKIILTLAFALVTSLSVRSFINDISWESTKEYASFFFGYSGDHQLGHSDFLEKYYVNTDSTNVVASDSTRNLVFIFLESMENTFVPYMSQFRNVVSANESFYSNGKLSGGTDVRGAQMTITAMVSKTTGLPLLYSNDFVQKLSTVQNASFFQKQKSLYDILNKHGYRNVYMQGSDATFAGTRIFFEQHGIEKVYDVSNMGVKQDLADSLKKIQFHPGFTDRTLFREARNVLDTLSKSSKFSLTLATIDTHFPRGFYDDACEYKPVENSDDDVLKAVLKCESKELVAFIEWIKKQPFASNTEIVLVGDHLFMSEALVKDVSNDERKFLTVFMNSKLKNNVVNRDFASFDIFPTILESMNFKVEGSKLGLGVSLLSEEKTLLEKMGKDSLNRELKRLSKSVEYQTILY